jgi:tetratricopeptide (TPR) repeat protein
MSPQTDNASTVNPTSTLQTAVSEELLSQLSLRIEDCFAPSPEDVAASKKEPPPAEVAMWQEGLAQVDRAIAKDPHDARAWFNKAHILAALKRYDEAMVCFTRSVKIEPRNTAMLKATIDLCALQGRHEHALAPPVAEVVVHGLPRAQPLRQITPRRPGTQDPQNAIEHLSGIARWPASCGRARRQDRMNQFPLFVSQFVSFHECRPPCRYTHYRQETEFSDRA